MTETDTQAVRPLSLAEEVRLTRLPSPETRRAIRDAAGVSLRRFAKALKVSHGSIAYYERGGQPRPEIAIRYRGELERLAAVVGFDLDEKSSTKAAA